MATKLPFLYRRQSGRFYIRLILPRAVLNAFPNSSRDIRLSLNTHNHKHAERLSYVLRLEFSKLVDSILHHRFTDSKENLSPKISLFLRQLALKHQLKDQHPMSDESTDLTELLNHQRASEHIEDPIYASSETPTVHTFIEKRQANRIPVSETTVEKDGHTVTFNFPDDPEREFEMATRLMGGNYGSAPIKNYSVEYVFSEYLKKEFIPNSEVKPRTQDEYIKILNQVKEILGPKENYYTLTYDDAEALRNKILQLKDQRAKDQESAKTISPGRAKKYLDKFKILAKYAKRKGFNPIDISEGLTIVVKEVPKKDEDIVFSDEEIQALLGGYPYTHPHLKRARDLWAFHFWLIPLLMFTGSRISEACALRLSDIGTKKIKVRNASEKRYDYVPYIDIYEETKTGSSIRQVPLHKQLLELGFLDFVDERRKEASGSDLLFEGLVWDTANKWGGKPSDWFNGGSKQIAYKSLCLPPKQCKLKNAHTFRHTFIDVYRDTSGIDRTLLPNFVGHEKDEQTDRYGKRQVALNVLQDEMNKVEYDVDFSHLDYQKFKIYQKARGKIK